MLNKGSTIGVSILLPKMITLKDSLHMVYSCVCVCVYLGFGYIKLTKMEIGYFIHRHISQPYFYKYHFYSICSISSFLKLKSRIFWTFWIYPSYYFFNICIQFFNILVSFLIVCNFFIQKSRWLISAMKNLKFKLTVLILLKLFYFSILKFLI